MTTPGQKKKPMMEKNRPIQKKFNQGKSFCKMPEKKK
jgi:hypothetical protein